MYSTNLINFILVYRYMLSYLRSKNVNTCKYHVLQYMYQYMHVNLSGFFFLENDPVLDVTLFDVMHVIFFLIIEVCGFTEIIIRN